MTKSEKLHSLPVFVSLLYLFADFLERRWNLRMGHS